MRAVAESQTSAGEPDVCVVDEGRRAGSPDRAAALENRAGERVKLSVDGGEELVDGLADQARRLRLSGHVAWHGIPSVRIRQHAVYGTRARP